MVKLTKETEIYFHLVDCEWNEWVLGECSTTCGDGIQVNNRTKLQEELHGGVCEGVGTETVKCNLMVCPRKCLTVNISSSK